MLEREGRRDGGGVEIKEKGRKRKRMRRVRGGGAGRGKGKVGKAACNNNARKSRKIWLVMSWG